MFLLLSVCLIAQPAKCHDERINLNYDNPNPFLCLRNSQSTLAAWQEEHPDYHVKSWRCAPQGEPADRPVEPTRERTGKSRQCEPA
ncbi:conserved protein of unknown function [Methylorubrum extorquens]|uniref:Uncharacterized protein n=1 Tax=Methylorubrum extorquens TaxID=408 RepID=A0A2N9ATT1_METEX|nr:conserved protein of unknown function [Methylorubrum extorquens]